MPAFNPLLTGGVFNSVFFEQFQGVRTVIHGKQPLAFYAVQNGLQFTVVKIHPIAVPVNIRRIHEKEVVRVTIFGEWGKKFKKYLH